MIKGVYCKICDEEVDTYSAYSTIEHWNLPGNALKTFYFHKGCFLEVAGKQYGSGADISEHKPKGTTADLDNRKTTEQYAMENLWPD